MAPKKKAAATRRKTAPKAAAPEETATETAKPESVKPETAPPETVKSEDEKKQDVLDLVMETVEAMFSERAEDEKIWGSMVKQTLRRRKPGFNESYYGFSSFGKLLDELESRKLLELEHDEKSGGVVIKGFNPDY